MSITDWTHIPKNMDKKKKQELTLSLWVKSCKVIIKLLSRCKSAIQQLKINSDDVGGRRGWLYKCFLSVGRGEGVQRGPL